MQQLKKKTKALILLTATPMQIDPIEVFDLLNLVGLQGQQNYIVTFYPNVYDEKPSLRLMNFGEPLF